MADLVYFALMAGGTAVWWWQHMRPRRRRAAAPPQLAPDAEIAIHVAVHEADTRGHEPGALHVLYGLLQDDAIVASIKRTGGDPDALEDDVLRALDAPPADGSVAFEALLGHRDRPVTCVDLWSAAGQAGPIAALLDGRAIDRCAVLFDLVHGDAPPDVPRDATRPVVVVLRNDDYTTMEFVAAVLRETFELTDERAIEVMMAAHGSGRAELGGFPPATARARIDEVRSRARAQMYPLWIGVEPV